MPARLIAVWLFARVLGLLLAAAAAYRHERHADCDPVRGRPGGRTDAVG